MKFEFESMNNEHITIEPDGGEFFNRIYIIIRGEKLEGSCFDNCYKTKAQIDLDLKRLTRLIAVLNGFKETLEKQEEQEFREGLLRK